MLEQVISVFNIIYNFDDDNISLSLIFQTHYFVIMFFSYSI